MNNSNKQVIMMAKNRKISPHKNNYKGRNVLERLLMALKKIK